MKVTLEIINVKGKIRKISKKKLFTHARASSKFISVLIPYMCNCFVSLSEVVASMMRIGTIAIWTRKTYLNELNLEKRKKDEETKKRKRRMTAEP